MADPTFVLFYVDWCHYCNAVKPIWHQLSQQNLPAKIVSFGYHQFNGIYDVIYFPTIRYYPDGMSENNQFMEYHGDRTLNNFIEFVMNGGQENQHANI
jgi:thiol-disulfide isomerase/thioredoxin